MNPPSHSSLSLDYDVSLRFPVWLSRPLVSQVSSSVLWCLLIYSAFTKPIVCLSNCTKNNCIMLNGNCNEITSSRILRKRAVNQHYCCCLALIELTGNKTTVYCRGFLVMGDLPQGYLENGDRLSARVPSVNISTSLNPFP